MKRKVTLKERLRIASMVFLKSKSFIIIQCNHCNSTNISFKTITDTPNYYQSEYTCNNCGANGIGIEQWESARR